MRKSLYCALAAAVVLGVASCRRPADDHAAVRQAAEEYYGYLIAGDVDRYMQGMHDYESLPEDYREELRDMFLQYLDDERRLRGGLASARAVRDTIVDSLQAHVFVELVFGDSTCENVYLPLVRTDGGWRMQ